MLLTAINVILLICYLRRLYQHSVWYLDATIHAQKKRNKIKNVGDSIDDRQHGLIQILIKKIQYYLVYIHN